jgi:hypothetical protein
MHPIESTFLMSDGDTLTASASSYFLPNMEAPFRALFGPESSEHATANQWTTANQTYSDQGRYAGTYSCCSTLVDGEAVAGEWLQAQYGAPRTFRGFSIMSNYLNSGRAPRDFVLAGSDDGKTWTALHREEGMALWGRKAKREFLIKNPLPLTYYRLIVQSTVDNEGFLTVDKLLFF